MNTFCLIQWPFKGENSVECCFSFSSEHSLRQNVSQFNYLQSKETVEGLLTVVLAWLNGTALLWKKECWIFFPPLEITFYGLKQPNNLWIKCSTVISQLTLHKTVHFSSVLQISTVTEEVCTCTIQKRGSVPVSWVFEIYLGEFSLLLDSW